jgi:hypothetical protein
VGVVRFGGGRTCGLEGCIMRQDTRLALKRHAIELTPSDNVRLVVTFCKYGDPEASVNLECLVCEWEALQYDSSTRLFICPTCGFEVTPKEVSKMSSLALFAIDEFNCMLSSEKRLSWVLVMLFRKLLGVVRRLGF